MIKYYHVILVGVVVFVINGAITIRISLEQKRKINELKNDLKKYVIKIIKFYNKIKNF
jgi:uncharacterized membrane-anchored protein YhcB (DUF1043 family)